MREKRNKETLAQVFSCEFCKISKNSFFTEHLRTTASEYNIAKENWSWESMQIQTCTHLKHGVKLHALNKPIL